MLRLCFTFFAFGPPGMLVAEVCFPYLLAPPALDISILSQDHQQQMKRSRLVIFSDFSQFFRGYRQILEGCRGQNLRYQQSVRVDNF